MAEIKSVHKLYWHTLKYHVKPKIFIEKAETQLIDPPYNSGKGLAIRFPFTKHALVVGWWIGRYTENNALTKAIGGRILPIDDSSNWDQIRSGE